MPTVQVLPMLRAAMRQGRVWGDHPIVGQRFVRVVLPDDSGLILVTSERLQGGRPVVTIITILSPHELLACGTWRRICS